MSELPLRLVIANNVDTERAPLMERIPQGWSVHDASDLADAVSAVLDAGIDGVLVVRDGDIAGFGFLRRARAELPDAPIVAVTPGDDGELARRAVTAGATSAIPESVPQSEFIGVVRAARRGQRGGSPSASPQSGTVKAALSERELQVLRLIARGYTNKEAATKLGISVKSVETYRSRGLEKLGLKTRADVVRYAIDTGLLHDSGEDD